MIFAVLENNPGGKEYLNYWDRIMRTPGLPLTLLHTHAQRRSSVRQADNKWFRTTMLYCCSPDTMNHIYLIVSSSVALPEGLVR